ncbi:putative disease resistance protein RGA3 [Jatropha curcas]|uniref:putative disease resistance protein RGA3 n=1 Tax=Jatropha curcas TaxID=180498 RepID=UPI001896320F|nr:putative disease resistance protein RGA3 [Jatropha curcas]
MKDGKISVIPIVGIGGLGKTALAKLIYNDDQVKRLFEVKMWVCVSEDFDIKILTEKIIKSTTNGMRLETENLSNLEMEQLTKILQKTIGEKKYLLVLDDVWNNDPMKWNQLKELLYMGGNGSKILVTTRSNQGCLLLLVLFLLISCQVFLIVGSVPAYELLSLSHDESMALFTKFAFTEGQEKRYPNLLKIGDGIVKKCRGVPLAVKTLASLLLSKTDEDYWNSIRDNELWKLEQGENDILHVLKLSYEQLPSDLKRCLAYCSLYPKDHVYNHVELAQVWIAHGLVRSMNENEELEDAGLRYLKELASKCFFQDFEERYGFIKCKMHDLVHDLALSLTQNEYSIVTSSTRQIPTNVRHLLFPDNASLPQDLSTILQGLDRARTIVFMSEERDLNSKLMLDVNWSRFQYLRMLDLSQLKLDVPLERIGTLKHLRFFHLHGNSKIIKAPDFICKLQNLQALLLCQGLEELPANIKYLISLRLLQMTTKEERLLNNGIGCLKSLRFLFIFDCENLKYLCEDMQGLSKLQKLIIIDCKSLICLPPSIKYLSSLKTLMIGGCENIDLDMVDEENFNQLSLQNLALAELPKLVNFPYWLLEGSKYTLQNLHLEDCSNLEELPACLQNIVSLQQLKIENCFALGKRCEREKGEDWSKIAHIPQVIVDG